MIRNVNESDDRNRYLPLQLGRIGLTPGAMEAVEATGFPIDSVIIALLGNHSQGHWGVLDAEDKQANDDALRNGGRILSAYLLPLTNVKVWVITEADRQHTTILLPEEY